MSFKRFFICFLSLFKKACAFIREISFFKRDVTNDATFLSPMSILTLAVESARNLPKNVFQAHHDKIMSRCKDSLL